MNKKYKLEEEEAGDQQYERLNTHTHYYHTLVNQACRRGLDALEERPIFIRYVRRKDN